MASWYEEISVYILVRHYMSNKKHLKFWNFLRGLVHLNCVQYSAITIYVLYSLGNCGATGNGTKPAAEMEMAARCSVRLSGTDALPNPPR